MNKINAAGRDLTGYSLSGDYIDCDFTKAKLNGAHLEGAFLGSCNFTGADFVNATFKLACNQGTGNVLDNMNAAAFLYWMDTVFTLSPEMHRAIQNVIAPYVDRLKVMFNLEIL